MSLRKPLHTPGGRRPLLPAAATALLFAGAFACIAPAAQDERLDVASHAVTRPAPVGSPSAAPDSASAETPQAPQTSLPEPATAPEDTVAFQSLDPGSAVIAPVPTTSPAHSAPAPATAPAPTFSAAAPPAGDQAQADAPVHASPACAELPLGAAWAGVGSACRAVHQPAPTIAPTPGHTTAQYARLIQDIVAPWCQKVRVLVDDPTVVSGNIYGMSWWGTNDLAVRSGIPMAITKDMALHECGHILQARVFPSKSAAIKRFNEIHGTGGTDGLEQDARCISAHLSPHALPSGVGAGPMAARWANECSGAKGEAAIAVIKGIRP